MLLTGPVPNKVVTALYVMRSSEYVTNAVLFAIERDNVVGSLVVWVCLFAKKLPVCLPLDYKLID